MGEKGDDLFPRFKHAEQLLRAIHIGVFRETQQVRAPADHQRAHPAVLFRRLSGQQPQQLAHLPLLTTGQTGEPRGELVHRASLQLSGDDLRDGIKRIRRNRLFGVDHRLPNRAAPRDDHQQQPSVGNRHQLQMAEYLFLARRAGHHGGGVVRHAGKRFRNSRAQLLHLIDAVIEAALDKRGFFLAERHGVNHPIHVKPVCFIGGDSPGRRVRGIEIAKLFQIAHLVADGGGGELLFIFSGNRSGADRQRGHDVVVNDRLQDAILTINEIHARLPPFGCSLLLALNRFEC